MREAVGDMFDKRPRSALVISTNGFIKANGECVMGRGCALDATRNWPELAYSLGKAIKTHGNHVHSFYLGADAERVVSFPVKPVSKVLTPEADISKIVVKHMRHRFKPGDTVPGWACVAEARLIMRSANELVTLTNANQWEDVVCPQFGCGFGELAWSDIKQMLDPILDDRFICMSFR